MFSYHSRLNTAKGITTIIGIALIASIAISLFALRNSEITGILIIRRIISHITSSIYSATLLGIFYSSLIGGLFFIFLPMEVIFAKFVNSGYPIAIVFAAYMSGLVISYTADYFIGMKLANASKKIITPRKFYSTKGHINRYGGLAVFIFNVLPLPSQPLAAILGVFKYNKTRFYVYFICGQLVKITSITLGIKYMF